MSNDFRGYLLYDTSVVLTELSVDTLSLLLLLLLLLPRVDVIYQCDTERCGLLTVSMDFDELHV